MGGFLRDLNDILSSNPSGTPDFTVIAGVGVAAAFVGLVALVLAIRAAIKLLSKKPKPKQEPVASPKSPPENIKVEVGEFGKIVSEKKVSVRGSELDYFIIKKSKNEPDTLPIGTIVVIIKQNANEAYVKPADDKDVARLKNVL